MGTMVDWWKMKSDPNIALSYAPATQVPGIKMIQKAHISLSMFIKHQQSDSINF